MNKYNPFINIDVYLLPITIKNIFKTKTMGIKGFINLHLEKSTLILIILITWKNGHGSNL